MGRNGQLGKYKKNVLSNLRKNKDIQNILLYGETINDDVCVDDLLKEHIYPFLYIPPTQQNEKKSYICTDVVMVDSSAEYHKYDIIVYVYCHKDIMDCNYTCVEKYNEDFEPYGTRADLLGEIVNQLLEDSKQENGWIGKLKLDTIDLFNSEKLYYGKILTYNAYDFK